MSDLVILGLGNLLMQDDGLGVRAIELLSQRFAPDAATRVLDGGTLGLSLLPAIEDARAVLIVDAVRASGEPGDMVRMEADEIPPLLDIRLSPHEIGVVDLLRGLTLSGRRPAQAVLVGLVPAQVELGYGLSPEVARALPELVERVVVEAAALGHPLTRISS